MKDMRIYLLMNLVYYVSTDHTIVHVHLNKELQTGVYFVPIIPVRHKMLFTSFSVARRQSQHQAKQ